MIHVPPYHALLGKAGRGASWAGLFAVDPNMRGARVRRHETGSAQHTA